MQGWSGAGQARAGARASGEREDRVSEIAPSLSVTRNDSAPNGAGRRTALLLAAALFTLPSSAGAGGQVPPDPWQIIHVAREFGPAEVARDGMGDPQIRGTIDGLDYRLTFYGCRLGRDCDTILFDARLLRKEWDEKRPPAELFSGWNRTKLFGRAWLDEERRAVLDHAVALGPGVPKATLRASFERWRTALAEYAGHLGIR